MVPTSTAPAASPGAPAGESTIQLIGIRLDGFRAFAIVQRDDLPPAELTWSLLHEAQQQEAPAGCVYSWLMREYTRAEYRQRNGKPWTSPRRTIREIVTEEIGKANSDAVARTAAVVRQAEIMAKGDREFARKLEAARVAYERTGLSPSEPWYPVHSWEIPDRLRFDTLPADAGQTVEVSYGTFSRAQAGASDEWKRIEDRSEFPNSQYRVRYYRRRDVSGQSGQSGQ